MTTVQVLKSVPTERILETVPPIYRPTCDQSRLKEASYTVLVFPVEKVVLSTVVAKALKKVGADAAVVALAYNLTAEGLALLAERNATVFLLHGVFHWTDESYRSVA